MSHERTERLRELASAVGLRYARGYRMPDGRTLDGESVTTLYPSRLTFSEDEDGHLWCEDDLDPVQALVLGMVGWREADE